jgi:hypothetical protein
MPNEATITIPLGQFNDISANPTALSTVSASSQISATGDSRVTTALIDPNGPSTGPKKVVVTIGSNNATLALTFTLDAASITAGYSVVWVWFATPSGSGVFTPKNQNSSGVTVNDVLAGLGGTKNTGAWEFFVGVQYSPATGVTQLGIIDPPIENDP